MKAFALNLRYLSKSAYDYVRSSLSKLLPSNRTMQVWLSKIDCSAGVTAISIRMIREKAIAAAAKQQSLLVALSMDEMAIRKHVIWDKNKNMFIGYVNFDTYGENDVVANKVLVFMVTAVNQNWKIPIGFFYVSRLDSNSREILIKMCLEQLSIPNLEIMVLIFDGDKANLKAVESMGASFKNDTIRPEFINPYTDKKIAIMLDMCHALKLVRNNFFRQKEILYEGQIISCHYIAALEKLQNEQGLHLGNKLSIKHIEYQSNVMNVRIAAETLSESVATCLDYVREALHLDDFAESGPTADFCRTINRIFDIFNSYSTVKGFYKSPLSQANKDVFFRAMDQTAAYIEKLKTTEGQLLTASKAKTGFLGIVFNIASLKAVFARCVDFYYYYLFIYYY
jgi:DNA transposase THAP9